MNSSVLLNRTFVWFAMLCASAFIWNYPAQCAENLADAGNNQKPKEAASLLTGENNFDFGTVHQMDSTQSALDIQKSTNFEFNLRGIKHVFTLTNNSKSELTLAEIDTNNGSIQAVVFENKRPHWNWYRLAAGAKVDILMAFNYYDAPPGHSRAEIRIMPSEGNKPLAILAMQGIIKNGIVASEEPIDFGKISKKHAYRDFLITFDKRLPLRMLPEVAQVFSANKHLKIQLLDAGKTIMGIQIKEDSFKLPLGFKELPEDFVLKVRLSINDNVPNGKLTGEVGLKLVDFPLDQITENVRIPIRGEVLIQ